MSQADKALRKFIIGKLSAVQMYEPDAVGEREIETAADKIMALFATKQHQLLAEIMEQQQLITEHYDDGADKRHYWAVPIKVIQNKQESLKNE